MARGGSIGALWGIPVRVDPSFLILSAFIGLTGGRGVEGAAVWVVVVGFSVLVHEFGHALVFRSFGVRSSVLLYAMGGLTAPEAGPRLRPRQDVLVSLAGPGVGLILGGVVALLVPPGDFAAGSLPRLASLYLLFVNVAWGLVNLLPILPLDGGNVMAAVLERTMGARGPRVARIISLVTAGALGAAGLAYGQPFVAILAFYFGAMNLGALRDRGESRLSPSEEILHKGVAALAAGNQERAEWAARHLLEQPAAPPEIKGAAAELLTWTGLAGGSLAMATAGLDAAPPGHPPGALAVACVGLARDGAEAAAAALVEGLCEGSWIIPRETVATALLRPGLPDELVRRLVAAPDRARAAAGLARLQEIFHRSGHYATSARVGRTAFTHSGNGVMAFNIACSLSRSEQADEAVEWLSRAIDAGWHDVVQLDGDEDLVPVRAHPRFAQLRAQLVVGAAGGPG